MVKYDCNSFILIFKKIGLLRYATLEINVWYIYIQEKNNNKEKPQTSYRKCLPIYPIRQYKIFTYLSHKRNSQTINHQFKPVNAIQKIIHVCHKKEYLDFSYRIVWGVTVLLQN